MSASYGIARRWTRGLRSGQIHQQFMGCLQKFTTTSSALNELIVDIPSKQPELDPNTVTTSRDEKRLMKSGVYPIGSRRRRAAIKTSDNIPFEHMPYHCFQEARKVLSEERDEILEKIRCEKLRISKWLKQDVSNLKGGLQRHETRLRAMKNYMNKLKIQADINDPLIKKRFEDGLGDMNKPIYRYLAEKKWKEYAYPLIMQRIDQFSIVPDLQPFFDPSASVQVAFRQRKIKPGDYVDSRMSQVPGTLKIQVFDPGERLITVVMVDSDVPDVEKNSFMSRCHFLAVNIPLSPTQTSVPLSRVSSAQLVAPWLPPFAQRGTPYHRYSIFVLQQNPNITLDVSELQKQIKRDHFSMQAFVSCHKLRPIGLGLFRSIWDEGTINVMQEASIEGAEIIYKRKKVIALKPKERPRGWDAKHAHPKYDAMMGKNRRPFSKVLRKR
ncbi:BgTH12-07037 [Blumeria graminis f. sp. triticale]|uniref:Large ribosomal subunit protein mL38 n=3 Tax=Blumeria graminis TaxID=34373 RepID=A0A061HG37_BLUGR|nr:Mitochondrial ribosomal protein [Blumeria graminis f. sp. tritici 96224]CAD6506107.1 BgTH12-07037 [Blumeria graminis f. sp. triticale]VDB94783.1 Bgt-5055 [Blumeria graminis f. sp. tritici]